MREVLAIGSASYHQISKLKGAPPAFRDSAASIGDPVMDTNQYGLEMLKKANRTEKNLTNATHSLIEKTAGPEKREGSLTEMAETILKKK